MALSPGQSNGKPGWGSGHLNPRKLYKPPETIFQHWRNSNRTWEKPTHSTPTIPPASRNKEVSEMKDAWVHFTVSTALHPDDTHNTPLFRYLNPRVQASRALKDGASAALQEEEKELKTQETDLCHRGSESKGKSQNAYGYRTSGRVPKTKPIQRTFM